MFIQLKVRLCSSRSLSSSPIRYASTEAPKLWLLVQTRLFTVGDRTCPVAATKLWNKLLFTASQSLSTFSRLLKSVYFETLTLIFPRTEGAQISSIEFRVLETEFPKTETRYSIDQHTWYFKNLNLYAFPAIAVSTITLTVSNLCREELAQITEPLAVVSRYQEHSQHKWAT